VKIFDWWLVVQTVSGTIGIVLVLNGLLEPLLQFKEMDGRPGYCFGLFCTNTYSFGLVRNAGFFDEPGALAFWGIYALLINKMFIQNKKIEYLLIFGLISTMSLTYYLQLSIFLCWFYRTKGWKFICLVIGGMLILYLLASYNSSMADAIFGRLEYDENRGTIQGDNRSELLAKCWSIFIHHPIFGIGAQYLTSSEIRDQFGFVGANFFTNWAADGIIGVFITYLPIFSLIALKRYNTSYLIISIILFIGFLQRPYDSTQLLYPLLTYTILLNGYRMVKPKN